MTDPFAGVNRTDLGGEVLGPKDIERLATDYVDSPPTWKPRPPVPVSPALLVRIMVLAMCFKVSDSAEQG